MEMEITIKFSCDTQKILLNILVIDDFGNGLVPIRHQTFTQINAVLFMIIWWNLVKHHPNFQTFLWNYCQTSNISHTFVDNRIVDHSNVVGAALTGDAPTTSSFSTYHLASIDCPKTTARWDEKHLSFGRWCISYQRFCGEYFLQHYPIYSLENNPT